ncbi:MAG: hypothetical protein GC161_17945 [Planctomycetaceae bacterium]|nr:hypothetical protein [Planctomycetaceae bacterium]
MPPSPQLPSTQRVWPVGMERPAPSRAAEGTDRAALFGRELDRVRRPSQLLDRDEPATRAEPTDGAPAGRAEGAQARRESPAPEAPTPGQAIGAPTDTAESATLADAPPTAGDGADATADVPAGIAEQPRTGAGAQAPIQSAAAARGTPAAPPNAPLAAPQAPVAIAAARVADAPTTSSALTTTAAARRDAPRAAATSAPAANFDAVLEQVQAELRPNLRQALVVLEPADLGRVAVRVRMGAEGLTATLRAESPETRELLERHLPELRASFEAAGLAVNEITVELDGRSGGEHMAGSGRESQPPARPQSGSHRAESPNEPTPNHRPSASADGSVDTYA